MREEGRGREIEQERIIWVHLEFTQLSLKLFPPVQLSQLVVNSGGVAAVVDYIGETKGNIRLPGIMMLGYVAAHSEVLAMSVIVSKVHVK